MKTITLHTGQSVPFPRAPEGWAQIYTLGLTNVVLAYRRNGHLCRYRLPAMRVAELMERMPPLLFAEHNLLGVGVIKRAKTYTEGMHYGFPNRRQISAAGEASADPAQHGALSRRA